MKTNHNSQRLLQTALAGLGLLSALNLALAVPDRVINTFDADINGCGNAWGAAVGSFDPAQDNTGNGGGSLYITSDFAADQNTLTYFCNQAPNGGWWFPGPAWNMTDYASVEFDIKWDTSKTLSIADFNNPPLGGEGNIAIWATDYPNFSARPTIGYVSVPAGAATGWVHVSLPINPATANIDPSVGIVFKKWISADQKTAGGTYGFWVDNVTLKGTDAPPPPPTLTLEKSVPGLALIAASGGQYDRQNIRTVASNYSWIGASGPVSYSINVAQHAPKAYNGFQLHMYLVPGDSDLTRSDCDWHERHVVMWRIQNQADGGAWSDLNYKTNAPDNNGLMYGGTGAIGGVWSPTPAGIWTLTFNQDTNLTITTPAGGTFTTNLPPDVVALFNENPHMQIAVGVVPGDLARAGQKVILNGVSITGTPGQPNVNSSFVGQPLDTNIWFINASSAAFGVQEISSATPLWLNWSLPAVGFSLQSSDKAAGGIWAAPALTGYDAGGKHYELLRQSSLPGTSAGFYRMLKREATKLQVLMPGETAAPGTPTGKTGTATPQDAGTEFDVVVNLVDNDWNVVSISGQEIKLATSDDATATLPANGSTVNGSVTMKLTLWLPTTTYTVTATNVTNGAITPGTTTVTTN